MSSFARMRSVAAAELGVASRSRRALATVLIFSAITGIAMYLTISMFAAIEAELLKLLALPDAGETGSVTMTLWQSDQFNRMVSHMTRNSAVFADIQGRHPVVLAYAFFLFSFVPLVTLMTSSASVASDIRSGSVRYMLVRVSRAEWSIGKFFGEAAAVLAAMAVGALAAWAVAICRLPGWSALGLAGGVFDWTLRAWIYSFAYLGLFMGLSHIVRSPGKATALSVAALVALGIAANRWPWLGILSPTSSQALLWRRDPAAFMQGAVHLASLAFLYLGLGAFVFSRRDV